MTSLPDRPVLRQLRTRAEELKRAFESGDQEAIDRMLASHPKFAGRPAERLEGWHSTLRDAQATIARELGFDSWKALAAEIGDAPRWDASASSDMARRAFVEARDLRHGACIDLHFLLALLNPSTPTVAAKVLDELGLTHADVRRHVSERMRAGRRGSGTYSSPTYQLVLGWAQGIALGMGATRLTDEHILMAIVYGDYGGDPRLEAFGIDPDEVMERLRAHGAQTPRVEPPASQTPPGPLGPWVYFPKHDWGAVTQELGRAHPPGTAQWGTNASNWKKGHWYVVGEDAIPMEAIVRRAVRDPSVVEVLPFREGSAREGQAIDRGRRGTG
jgi:Clp amino terminal domain, pathogenicity island component